MSVLILADLIWIIVMFNTWDHTDTNNVYWNSLSGIHGFVKFISFVEFFLKGLIVAYLVYDYKQKHPGEMSKIYLDILTIIGELLNLSYLQAISGESKKYYLI
jgi:hypothetical protein